MFNEDSRVKIPSIIHLTRLGYQYCSLKHMEWDESSNIVPALFTEAISRINPDATAEDIERTLMEISFMLDNEDLGKKFYERLTNPSGLRLIDFDDFDQNSFHVVTEFTCKNEDEEFRPDITLLINGLPLVFIEVKKPNNRDGILAERKRMVRRHQNSKFRRFINITQIMVFSNNMEYDDESPEPLEGAFYASTAYSEPKLNYFREEEDLNLAQLLAPESSEIEDLVLSDNNLNSIKHAPEFALNKQPTTPTNRLSTSLFSRDRLKFLLQFGIAYVKTGNGFEKHIMRYPQIFASKAISKKLDEGVKKGIIWHTQGSGKTALAFYNVHYLTDYYRRIGVIPKFYFIVDRIDLFDQACREFRNRGLYVHNVNSREEFAGAIKSNLAVHNNDGKPEITVVNIQKFQDDPDVVRSNDYAIDIQRVYFLDEVHRSYNPEGSFLANLTLSDPNAVRIGLTGTPLLNAFIRRDNPNAGEGEPQTTRVEYDSKTLFGTYIHKYYYNRSVADGYTLRLIREEIETQYRMELAEALKEIEVLKNSKNRTILYAHEKFVEPMLKYVVNDFENARILHNDQSIGAMVICDSADQAREMAKVFESKYELYTPEPVSPGSAMVAEPSLSAVPSRSVTSYALILHDVGTKKERKDKVEAFKEGKIDILFVFNMLLTGFDAHRLKKLYLGRVIKDHNLLQALTRVNRPYKSYRYGNVVDFVNITTEFEKANRNYFDELQEILGDEMESYSDLFKTEEEITADIEAIKDTLFHYDTQNAEVFSQQISEINERPVMQAIIKALNSAKSLYNMIRLSGQFELLEKLDFRMLSKLSIMASDRLALINQKEALESHDTEINLLNVALEDVIFAFAKISEAEMVIADQLKETLRRTREGLGGTIDPGDPQFLSLKEELERLFKKKNLTEISQEEMLANIAALDSIHERGQELERKNRLLQAKYENDAKYARLHKRLLEKGEPTDNERKLCEALNALKKKADETIAQNSQILENEHFAKAEMARLIIHEFKTEHNLPLSAAMAQEINSLVLKEYLAEYNGIQAA
ncbi:MAG: type I restriction endonuclease [Verrucomicrobiales bacterium]|nr:type I restriction endonuclease [Verrucomicrobiales bacterium]